MTAKTRKFKEPREKARVFLVDDNPAVLRGLTLFLGREPDLEICGSAGNAGKALPAMLAVEPDVAIIDLTLEEGDGMELVKELRAHSPELKVVVFSMHNHTSHIQAAFRAGAHGYVAKEEGTEQLVEAIRTVLGGRLFLTDAMRGRLGDMPGDRLRQHQ